MRQLITNILSKKELEEVRELPFIQRNQLIQNLLRKAQNRRRKKK